MKRGAFLAQQTENVKNFCGPLQAKGTLAAHGIEVAFRGLYRTRLHRHFDVFLPWDMTRALRRHSVSCRLHLWPKSTLLANITHSVCKGSPVILVTRSRVSGCLHWISVWAADTENNVFRVYDSREESVHGPHGNTTYRFDELVRTVPWVATFAIVVE